MRKEHERSAFDKGVRDRHYQSHRSTVNLALLRPNTTRRNAQCGYVFISITILLILLPASVFAELRTVTAIGEYRMGDNDTRSEAKRLALLDAKRSALEQAGTYIESLIEVKDFNLTKEEIRAYSAGIVEVTAQSTNIRFDGDTTVVHSVITAQIDTAMLLHQIQYIQQNSELKAELSRLRAERLQLLYEIEQKNRALASSKSEEQIISLRAKREQTLDKAESIEPLLDKLVDLYLESIEFNADAEKHLARAGELERAGDLTGAADEAAKAHRGHLLKSDFHKQWLAGSHMSLGQAFAKKGERANAIIQFRFALGLNPLNYMAHVLIADALAESGDLDGAIAEMHSGIHLNPHYVTAHYMLGEFLKRKGELIDAISEYKTALGLEPGCLKGICDMSLGLALLEKGEADEAATSFREALRFRPDEPKIRHNLGKALTRGNKPKEAIAEYQILLHQAPNNPIFHNDIGTAFLRDRSFDAAISEFREAIRLSPNEPIYHVNLGLSLKELGRAGEALHALREALRLDPPNSVAQSALDELQSSAHGQ